MAGFLSLREPSKAMKLEAAEAGMYDYRGTKYPRIQLLTVAEILEGKKDFDMPNKVRASVDTGQLPLGI